MVETGGNLLLRTALDWVGRSSFVRVQRLQPTEELQRICDEGVSRQHGRSQREHDTNWARIANTTNDIVFTFFCCSSSCRLCCRSNAELLVYVLIDKALGVHRKTLFRYASET
jgi:hypothetical protein